MLAKLIIRYSTIGRPYNDSKAEAYVQYADILVSSYGQTCTICTSTENIIHAARTLWKEKKLRNKPEIQYDDGIGIKIIPLSEGGRLREWPQGFCDYWDDWIDRLME